MAHSPQDTSVMLAIRIFGMQRSGNHAIISWLQRNLAEDDTIFFNDCAFGHPLTSFNTVEMRGRTSNHRIRKVMRMPKLVALLDASKTCGIHLISYENKQVQHRETLDGYMTPGYETAPAFKDIIITRGFLNWLASFYKLKLRTRPNWLDELNEIYIPAYVNHLQEAEKDDVFCIAYEDWASDETYRAGRLEALGIPCIDNDIGPMTTYGKGSSFEGADVAPETIAQAERWVSFLDDTRFKDAVRVAFEDDAFRALMDRHFGYSDDVLAKFGVPAKASAVLSKATTPKAVKPATVKAKTTRPRTTQTKTTAKRKSLKLGY